MQHTSSCRSTRLPFLILTFATILLLAGTGLAQGTFVSFDGPNAGTQQYQGTFPVAINPWGGVAIRTIGDNGVAGSYVRHPNGAYLKIHVPNTKPASTYISGLNAHGQVTGSFYNARDQELGYIRNVDGTYVILSVPGSTSTEVAGINDAGQVAGNAYINGFPTPFFWDPALPNIYVTYQIPGEPFATASAINDNGQIAGSAGTNTQTVGYLRQSDGTISTFTLAPYLAVSNFGVGPMNKWGTIVGGFFDSNGSDSATFLRYSGGGQKYEFGLSHGALESFAINDNGVVVGTEFSGDINFGNAFSFDRTFKVSLIPVPFTSQGSTAYAINNVGQIVGNYIDANGASHGWIYLP